MNEIALSSDLNVITAEINSYKQIAGQSIFEIGKRLKHVKENDLVHGEFMEWYESLGFTKDFVSKTIRIVGSLEDFETSRNLGMEALYLISTMPEEQRETPHTIPSTGETKTVDEMTVRELREVKAELKKVEQAKQQLESELENERNKESEIVEVVPEDYDELKGGYEAAERLRDRYKEENAGLRNELKKLSDSLKENSFDDSEKQRLEEVEKNLRKKITEYNKIHDIKFDLEQIITVLAPILYRIETVDVLSDRELRDNFESLLNDVIGICRETKDKLSNKNIIEGEIIDGV